MSLAIIPYIITFLVPVIGAIVGFFKVNKKHREEIDEHKGIEKSLREQIVDMVELQAEVGKVEKKSKKIKKDLDNMSDDDLNIAYSEQLPDMPKKRSRSNKKP